MQTLKRTLEIDAPPSEVWRVLTTPELVREWAAAYQDGIYIRTSWREGDRVIWKAPDGRTRSVGTVAAFKPEKLLKFVYDDGPNGDVAPEARSFSDTFEITEGPLGARLRFTTGPLEKDELDALEGPTEQAIREIKSLAEESAQIHGVR
jgi:uncharacterized protein YndB with AHSA1/START domain